MNTWFVGNHPIGHYVYQSSSVGKARPAKKAAAASESSSTSASPSQSTNLTIASEKTFFMKGRIMAGQADIEGNELGVEDFKWLAKEEIQKEVSEQYWASVKNMLVEQ